MQNELRARQHAAIILAIPDRESRQAALGRVPQADRAVVEFFVRDAFARRSGRGLQSLGWHRPVAEPPLGTDPPMRLRELPVSTADEGLPDGGPAQFDMALE